MTTNGQDAASLRERFLRHLRPDIRAAVDRIAATATQENPVFLVGGVVRDLLLGRLAEDVDVDVDLVTSADAIEIARRAAGNLPVTVHERFRTATIVAVGHRIDLATSRREAYARPGALPDVEPAGIEEDLRRRDFTMNALALQLTGEAVLVDVAGGQRDIEARVVRVLHDASFKDDATRIFRAFRYAARLGFVIEPHTASLIAAGLPFVREISGERLRHELHLLFDEPAGGRALQALDEAGALAAMHPALRWPRRKTDALTALRGEDRHEHGWALIASEASSSEAGEIAARLQLSQPEAAAVHAMPALASARTALRRADVKPSGVVTVLDRLPVAAIEAFADLLEDTALRDLLRRYVEQWRFERPLLSGHDLMAMGVPEGPRIKQALQLIRAARLDGWASDRDDERALVMRFAKSIRDSRAMNQPIDFKLYEN